MTGTPAGTPVNVAKDGGRLGVNLLLSRHDATLGADPTGAGRAPAPGLTSLGVLVIVGHVLGTRCYPPPEFHIPLFAPHGSPVRLTHRR